MEQQTAQQRHQQNIAVFTSLSDSLEQEAALREKIRDSVRLLETDVRALAAQSVEHPSLYHKQGG